MKSCCLTDVGLKRKMNQDFVYASDEPVGHLPNLFVVADGMGGHNAGDYASRCAVETMVAWLGSMQETRPVALLSGAITEANRAVASKAASDRSMEGMGTTMVAGTVMDDCLYVANVGDSRLYLLDEGICQITRDHSLVEEMVRAGQLRREDARTHPEKNVITRAVGVQENLRIDFFDVSLNPGDIILLCSDGLTNMVEDEEILRIVHEEASLEKAARRLVDTANKNGGSDNISVVLAEPEIRGE